MKISSLLWMGLQTALQPAQVVSDLRTVEVIQNNMLVLLCDYLYKPKEPHECAVSLDV
jgi:hypothetical protein